MSFLSDIEKIKDETFAFAVIDSILLLIPGLSFIFKFFREIFLDINIFKLVFLSVCVITPFLLFNMILFVLVLNKTNSQINKIKNDKEDPFIILTVSIVVSSICVYIGLGGGYLFNFTPLHTTYLMFLPQALITLLVLAALKGK